MIEITGVICRADKGNVKLANLLYYICVKVFVDPVLQVCVNLVYGRFPFIDTIPYRFLLVCLIKK
jgi:hypothetical protein